MLVSLTDEELEAFKNEGWWNHEMNFNVLKILDIIYYKRNFIAILTSFQTETWWCSL